VKRRWKVLLGTGGVLLAAALTPILYVEIGCRGRAAAMGGASHHPLIRDRAWRRDEVRTWLTYPEWHIVYSAESLGRFLERNPPSGYDYWRDIKGFWLSYCAVNQAAAASGGASADARVMLYTIGLSFSAEMLIKSAYENSIGRLFEWLGGWNSADDRYAASVQKRYGAFMHETPWYEFPFGQALSGLWDTAEPHAKARHFERRLALSAEYGVKAGYASLIGWASGASLGRDERTLRFVARAKPEALVALDPRLKPVARAGYGLTVVEAPRYAQFSELLEKLADANLPLLEIAGNDDIFLTVLMPVGRQPAQAAAQLMAMPLGDRPGWQRVGLTTKVPHLLALMRAVRRSGGEVEHVYDY
jgi:hypothetical protein